VQAVAAVAKQSPVAVNIVEITNKKNFKENYGIDAGLTLLPVIVSGGFIEESQTKFGLDFPVEIVFGHQSVQTELVEDLWRVFFLSLHKLI